FGITRSYRRFRNGVRGYYRRNYPLTAEARAAEYFNPGNARVSKLCHEPRVALAVLTEMLAPYVSSSRVEILLNHRPVEAQMMGDRVQLVKLAGPVQTCILHAPYFIDATELGDLLPLTRT